METFTTTEIGKHPIEFVSQTIYTFNLPKIHQGNISVLLKLPRRQLKQHKQHKMTNPNLFYNNSGSEFAGKDTQTESETKHGQNVPIKKAHRYILEHCIVAFDEWKQ